MRRANDDILLRQSELKPVVRFEGENSSLKRHPLVPCTSYEDLMALCSKVEDSLERSISRSRSKKRKRAALQRQPEPGDDMFRRLVRDANQDLPVSTPNALDCQAKEEKHYAFALPDANRYRSRFFPMRRHDLVKDDAAYRKLVR